MRILWLLLLLALGSTPALATDGDTATNFGQPLTLSSVNYAPNTTGIPTGDYDGDCTVNLVKSAGTFSVNVETMLEGGAFANAGTVTDTAMLTLKGPVQYVRFNVTACSSCLGKAILRCRVGK